MNGTNNDLEQRPRRGVGYGLVRKNSADLKEDRHDGRHIDSISLVSVRVYRVPSNVVLLAVLNVAVRSALGCTSGKPQAPQNMHASRMSASLPAVAGVNFTAGSSSLVLRLWTQVFDVLPRPSVGRQDR